jgi:hypothetical protein
VVSIPEKPSREIVRRIVRETALTRPEKVRPTVEKINPIGVAPRQVFSEERPAASSAASALPVAASAAASSPAASSAAASSIPGGGNLNALGGRLGKLGLGSGGKTGVDFATAVSGDPAKSARSGSNLLGLGRPGIGGTEARPTGVATGLAPGNGLPSANGILGNNRSGFRSPTGAGVKIAQSTGTAQKAVDAGAIRAVITIHNNVIRACYERLLQQQPGVAGKTVMGFGIDDNGRTYSTGVKSSTITDVALQNCLIRIFQRLEFPTMRGKGGGFQITYPLVFSPTD